MKSIIENIFGFLYTLSMGDYIFFIGTFVLLLCFVYIIYLIKRDDSMEKYYKNEESSCLENIKDKIEKEYKPKEIKLTDYEEEQEKSAIISYDELIKNKDKFSVSYDESYKNESTDIQVKKINIDKIGSLVNDTEELHVKLMNYDSEEEFLTSLKQLQHNLLN